MKKILKTTVLAICAVFAFILTVKMGGEYNVYAEDVIIPTYIGANGSTANENTYQFQKSESAESLSIPIQISNLGTVGLEVTVKTSADQELNVMLSKTASYKDIRYFLDLTRAKNSETANLSFYAKGACTWYLHVFRSIQYSNPDISVTVKAYQKGLPAGVTAGSGDLKNKQWASFCLADDETGTYKITIPSSGCVKFEIDCSGERAPMQTMLNSKKKEIGSSFEKVSYYGLKKGTYYIQFENPDIKENVYKMRYTFEKIKVAKNVKKSKAISLKKGKVEKKMFLTGNYYEHWYKLKLTKDQTVKLNLKQQIKGGKMSACLYSGDGMIKVFSSKKGKFKKRIKLKKGIYYLEVWTNSYPVVGYSLKWK